MYTNRIRLLFIPVVMLMVVLPLMGCSKTAVDSTSAAGNQPPLNQPDTRSSENGITEIRHTMPDGRIVFVYLPDSVQQHPTRKVPLVLALHATASNPRSVVYNCGWIDEAVKNNFIVIAPGYTSYADTEFFTASVAYALQNYPVDTRRVYATGFSNGGAACMALCRDHPGLFAAIAPMGWMVDMQNVNRVYETWDMPFQVIQGTNEYTYPTATGAMAVMQDEQLALRALMLYNELMSVSTQANYDQTPFWGYTPKDTRTTTVNGVAWQYSNYYKPGYAAPFGQLILIEGAAHRQNAHSANTAWAFFQQYARGEDGSVIQLMASGTNR